MSTPSFTPPPGFRFTRGDSIHTSDDLRPHLSGSIGSAPTEHFVFTGQTTLGMFDRECGTAHRLKDVENLSQQFPDTFRISGIKW